MSSCKETRNEYKELHSYDDHPSVQLLNGTKLWHKNGKYHRLNGPAIIYSDGYELYFIENIQYSKEDYFKFINLNNLNNPIANSIEPTEITINGIRYSLTRIEDE